MWHKSALALLAHVHKDSVTTPLASFATAFQGTPVTRRLAALLCTAPALLALAMACREIVAPSGAGGDDEQASLLDPSGRIVVHEADMKGWVFYNEHNGSACDRAFEPSYITSASRRVQRRDCPFPR